MSKLRVFLMIAFIAISYLSFAQSKDDYCEGNFSCPSYEYQYDGWENEDLSEAYCHYKFSDGTTGVLFKTTSCGAYFVKNVGVAFYYKDLSTAIKALYVYKKYGCNMEGHHPKYCRD